MPLKAASAFPARERLIGPNEFTYPVMRKKSATADRPPTARRKYGSWNKCGAVLGSWAGECSHGTNAVHKCPDTTVKEAMPRRPCVENRQVRKMANINIRSPHIYPVCIARCHESNCDIGAAISQGQDRGNSVRGGARRATSVYRGCIAQLDSCSGTVQDMSAPTCAPQLHY